MGHCVCGTAAKARGRGGLEAKSDGDDSERGASHSSDSPWQQGRDAGSAIQIILGNSHQQRRTRSPCCARAASGQAAAPPSSVMNSRRFMSNTGFLPRFGPAGCQE
jgi:hypothetical protein